MAKKSTSPWVYVGCGCASLVAMVILGIGAMGFAGFQFVKGIEEEFKDPLKRQESAMEILGADELPQGFRAQINVRIPLFFELVMLSDGEVAEYDEQRRQADLSSENLGDNAFIFMALPNVSNARGDIERLMEGKTRGLDNVSINLDFRSRKILGRGELDLPPQNVRYVAHRGEFRDDDNDEPGEGTYAVMMIDCPSSSKVRAAFYWQRHGQGAEEIEGGDDGDDVSLAGTPYEEDLRAFMGHFNVCPN